MDTAVENYDVDRKRAEKEGDAPRTDAAFTEIYELILYNQTMVKSEWEILLQLVQKKALGEGRGDFDLHHR